MLVELDDGAVTIILVVIYNLGYVIVAVSSPPDDKCDGAFRVVSTIVVGYGTVFLIVVIDKGSGAVIVAIAVTVFLFSLIVVIVLHAGSGAAIGSFVVVLVDIVKIEPVILDDGAVVVAVVVNNEGDGTI